MRGSNHDLPVAFERGDLVLRQAEWGEMNVGLERFPAGTDTEPVFKGLPDDRCQCPHWGYVIKGKMTARYADREEVFEAGDAFYSPPGHVPVANEPGTEFVWFSRSEELRTAEAVMMKNMQEMQDGSAP